MPDHTYTTTDKAIEHDAIQSIPPPSRQTMLIEHRLAENALLSAYKSGSMHPCWMLVGPKGIGKATLAFRFAKFVLMNPDYTDPKVQEAKDLSITSVSPTGHQDRGIYSDLIHISREYDEKNKRFKTEITVSEIRRLIGLLGKTATKQEGWKIAIIDTADDMNDSSANALLKVLEEPPQRVIFLILVQNHGKVLRTICSRCCRLQLPLLTDEGLLVGLHRFSLLDKYNISEPSFVIRLANGSLRRAISLCVNDGIAILDEVLALTEQMPNFDVCHASELASHVASAENTGLFPMCCAFIAYEAARRAKSAAISRNLEEANRWAEAYTEIERIFTESKLYNLDQSSTILSLFMLFSDTSTMIGGSQVDPKPSK